MSNFDPFSFTHSKLFCYSGESDKCHCTIVIGEPNRPPSDLVARTIDGETALISFVPHNSNYHHIVYINKERVRNLSPGLFMVRLWYSVCNSVHDLAYDSVCNSICDSVYDLVYESVCDSVCDLVRDSLLVRERVE